MIGADDRAALETAADILVRLPTVLAAERIRRGLSQEAAAEQIGVDRQTVSRWETRWAHPRWSTLPALLRWLAAQ